MQPKAQMPSTRCHKHRLINFVTWHSQKHAKWWMEMTRGVHIKCTNLVNYVISRSWWMRWWTNLHIYLTWFHFYVTRSQNSHTNSLTHLTYSVLYIDIAHLMFYSLTHLATSTHRHTPTLNIYKWNPHRTWLCASNILLVFTHWHDTLALSQNTHTLTPCSTHHMQTCSLIDIPLCISLIVANPRMTSTHAYVHWTSTCIVAWYIDKHVNKLTYVHTLHISTCVCTCTYITYFTLPLHIYN